MELKEAVKSLKRNAPDEDEEPQAPKAKKAKKTGTSDKYRHAEKAGKKFMANYCAFGEKEEIFEGFAEAAGETVDSDEEEDNDETSDHEEEENSSSDEEEDDDDDDNAETSKKSRYDFTSLEDRIKYVKDSGMRFYNEAEAKEVNKWQDDEYQARVSLSSPHMT